MKFVVLLALFAVAGVCAGGAAVEGLLQLDESNFDQHVGGDKPSLVEFYAPWCGHCKNLQPEYELLATTWKGQEVNIVQVDADAHRSLGQRFNVRGFPTIKYFAAGSKEPEDYNGGRSAKDFTDFLNKKTGLFIRVKTAPTAVMQLDSGNFESIVMDSKRDVLVAFTAPWCGHCKSLKPEFEKVANTYAGDDSIVIGNVDATVESELAKKYNVNGYPTLKFFPKNNKDGVDYDSGRSASDFVTFLNEKTGAQRVIGGGYLPTAGRIEALDELARKIAENPDDASLLASFEAAAGKLASGATEQAAKWYLNAARAVAKNGAAWASKEVARLERMIGSGKITPKARSDMFLRVNIVNQFKL